MERITIDVREFDGTTRTQVASQWKIRCDPENAEFFLSHGFVLTPDRKLMLLNNKVTGKNFWGISKGGIRSIPFHLGLPRYTRRDPEFKDAKTDFRKCTYMPPKLPA